MHRLTSQSRKGRRSVISNVGDDALVFTSESKVKRQCDWKDPCLERLDFSSRHPLDEVSRMCRVTTSRYLWNAAVLNSLGHSYRSISSIAFLGSSDHLLASRSVRSYATKTMKRTANGKAKTAKVRPRVPDYCEVEPARDATGTAIWPAPIEAIDRARHFIREW